MDKSLEGHMIWTSVFVNQLTLPDKPVLEAAEFADKATEEYNNRWSEFNNNVLGGEHLQAFAEPDFAFEADIPDMEPMSLSDLKVGDRVICIKNDRPYVKEGATGVIKSIVDPVSYMVLWDENEYVKLREDQPNTIWYIDPRYLAKE